MMDVPNEQLALGKILVSEGLDEGQRSGGEFALAGGNLMLGRPNEALRHLDSAGAILNTPEAQLQRREWAVHLAALGMLNDSARVNSARAWLQSRPLEGNQKVRALYALGRDALARRDLTEATLLTNQLTGMGDTLPSAARHAQLLRGELVAANGDAAAALDATDVIYERDTTLVRLAPFARAVTYLNRGQWQRELGQLEAADREWLWYESATSTDGQRARHRKASWTRF